MSIMQRKLYNEMNQKILCDFLTELEKVLENSRPNIVVLNKGTRKMHFDRYCLFF